MLFRGTKDSYFKSPSEQLTYFGHLIEACLCFLPILDVAVQLPDKKSIIMYLTSLFEVLPQQVTIDAIREVETLPRKYKKECEEGDVTMQVQAPSHRSAPLALSVTSEHWRKTLSGDFFS